MSDLIYVLPDTESICVYYLKHHDDVLALIPATAIAAELPPRNSTLFLQVVLDGGVVPVERRLVAARVRIESWGGTREDARDLCATAHAALVEMAGVQLPDNDVVTAVLTLTAPRKFEDIENDRPRYQAEVRVYSHPGESVS
jgi:hypothetical protein